MSTIKKNTDDQEIDLSDISRKMGNAFQSLNAYIFRAIQFALKHALILGILFVVGVSLGFYLDKTQKSYQHQIIVTPNFGSVDYLYAKINLLESKIRERDTTFLKSIGFKNPAKISRIEIDPIVDVYRFINTSTKEQNFQLLKLMAEDGDIKKIVQEPTTSKNYTYHAISLSTRKRTTNANTIQPLMRYLNDNEFFGKVQQEYVKNTKLKMQANEQMIAQIDGILSQFATSGSSGGSQVYISENTQLNDIIHTKDNLLDEQSNYRIELIGIDKIVKDNTVTTNIESEKSVTGKLKLILPILFIGIYLAIKFFKSFYRNQSRKAAQL